MSPCSVHTGKVHQLTPNDNRPLTSTPLSTMSVQLNVPDEGVWVGDTTESPGGAGWEREGERLVGLAIYQKKVAGAA